MWFWIRGTNFTLKPTQLIKIDKWCKTIQIFTVEDLQFVKLEPETSTLIGPHAHTVLRVPEWGPHGNVRPGQAKLGSSSDTHHEGGGDAQTAKNNGWKTQKKHLHWWMGFKMKIQKDVWRKKKSIKPPTGWFFIHPVCVSVIFRRHSAADERASAAGGGWNVASRLVR